MVREGTFAASEIAALGEAAGLERAPTLHLARRLGRFGVIETAFRDASTGPNSAYRHTLEQAAIALILCAVNQWAEIADSHRWRRLAAHLNEDAGGGWPLIRRIVKDIEDDGEPQLGVAIFALASGPPTTCFAVRLSDEIDIPIEPPADAVSYLCGAIALAPLLLPLIAAAHVQTRERVS